MTATRSTLLATFAALVVYLLTLAPDLTWSHFGNDGGELIAASVTLGTPHPPGYSSYTLLTHLLIYIPLGSLAYRFNLFSAVTMAAAAGVLAHVCLAWEDSAENRTLPIIPAIAAGLSFAFASGIWRQAVITEVYGLNLLLLSLLLLALVRRSSPLLLGLLWGLSITTHLTSLLWLPLIGLALWRRGVGRGVLGVVIGLLPLAVLPLFARGDSPVVWGDASSFSGWWWLVSGEIYRPNVLSIPHILPHLRESWSVALWQLAGVGWLAVAFGIYTAAKTDSRAQRVQTAGVLLVAVAYVGYAISYDAFDYTVFALPALLLLTPILYVGLRPLSKWSLILPLSLLALNFAAVSLHGDYVVRDQMQQALSQVPQNAVVITAGDQTTFSLWYFLFAEGDRPDVTTVDANMLAFDWYRARVDRLTEDVLGLEADNLDALQAETGQIRPICSFSIDPVVNVICKSNNATNSQ